MHRHGYKGRKFHRERDQRNALIKGLANSLVEHQSIETTLPKAKEVVSFTEKLITKAKKGNLHNRRQVISRLSQVANGHKLVDDIAPKLQLRQSGYLRIQKTKLRRGDNAQLARINFVDDLNEIAINQDNKDSQKKVLKSQPVTKKTDLKTKKTTQVKGKSK